MYLKSHMCWLSVLDNLFGFLFVGFNIWISHVSDIWSVQNSCTQDLSGVFLVVKSFKVATDILLENLTIRKSGKITRQLQRQWETNTLNVFPIIEAFHFFFVSRTWPKKGCGQGLVFLLQTYNNKFIIFNTDSWKNFKPHYFILTPISLTSHSKFCNILDTASR